MRKVAIVVLLSMSCLRGPLAAADSSPFKLALQGSVVVAVFLNGAGPFAMLLDTGASHSSVSEELAAALQLPVVARATVQSPAGDRERLITRIDHLMVGPHELSIMPAIIPKPYLALAGDVRGIIGQDVLAALRYTIDYRGRQILWDDRAAPARASMVAVLPLAFRDGLPVVELAQAHRTLSLVADSGAGSLVLFDRDGAGLPPMTADAEQVRLDTLHGHSLARSVRIDRFRVGGATFKDLPAVVLKGTSSAYSGDGLLPLHIFDRVTFDGPGGRLIVG
jgi:predicted aspartyl protease